MAKSWCGWHGSESVPAFVRMVVALIALVAMVFVLTLYLLPEGQFGFSSLVFPVIENPPPGPPLPHVVAIFGRDIAQPPANDAEPVLEKNSSVRNSSSMPEPSSPDSVVNQDEKFLAPLLSANVGAGNQLMEYISAAVIARALNRTLCLPPFFSGPRKHNGLAVRARAAGLMLEDRYNISTLSSFTKVASLEYCLQQCNYTLDSNVLLAPLEHELVVRGWKNFKDQNESWNLDWDYVEWQSTKDINATLGEVGDRCIGIAALFPGLRWRGASLAVSAFLQPSLPIFEAANILHIHGIGKDTPYLAVHWRFEESRCSNHQVGLCFSRCKDGSVVSSGLHPAAKEWLKTSQDECNENGHFRGVGLSKADIIATIKERAAKHSLSTLYLATDGWIRGAESLALLMEVVLSLRRRGLNVVGLWSIPDLPNFADGTYFDPYISMGKDHVINGQQIALVEQEICVRSAVFLGSGPSTWSLAVFRLRLAKRRSQEIMASVPNADSMDLRARDELISETLLKDDHVAGLQCLFSRFMKRTPVNESVETYADEYPDGWLDLDACEGRIGRGGHCQVAKCF
ncbi:hypothetical protein M758_11G006300 [Ceratodon purpureus]|nr:hypothetical protein M758_11G006300 [Ceratodon purpureus]